MITTKKGNICGRITYIDYIGRTRHIIIVVNLAEVGMYNDCRNYYYHRCSQLFIVCAIGRLSSISRESIIAVPNKRQT